MILADIRRYLQQRRQASLADLALHFDVDPDALRGMLDVWMRKGAVYKLAATAACGSSCTQCDSTATEVYAWLDSSTPRAEFLFSDCRQRSVDLK